MKTFYACHQGINRSGELVKEYARQGRSLEVFPGGYSNMLSMEQEDVVCAIAPGDEVVLIYDQLHAYETRDYFRVRRLLDTIGRSHRRLTFAQALDEARNGS